MRLLRSAATVDIKMLRVIALATLFGWSPVASAFLAPSVKIATNTPLNIAPIILNQNQHQQQQQQCYSIISPSLFAKKGKKGKAKKKTPKVMSGMEWATSFTLKPFEAQSTRDLVSTAVASFQGRKGSPLSDEVVGVSDIPKALWNAPDLACVIIGDEPQQQEQQEKTRSVVKYANVAALETFGLQPDQWDQLMWNPNPNADHPEPQVTLDLPATMKDKAYESGYQKKVIRKNDATKQQHDIAIIDAHRWKLEKSALVNGKFTSTTLGIAYAWREWIVDDSAICAPGGKQREKVDAQALQQSIEDQASRVRHLKEDQGLGNKDPKVQDAVAELLRLKSSLEKAQKNSV